LVIDEHRKEARTVPDKSGIAKVPDHEVRSRGHPMEQIWVSHTHTHVEARTVLAHPGLLEVLGRKRDIDESCLEGVVGCHMRIHAEWQRVAGHTCCVQKETRAR
jgi:hypothetical protein